MPKVGMTRAYRYYADRFYLDRANRDTYLARNAAADIEISGNLVLPALKTVDGVDVGAHAADLDAHTRNIRETMQTGQYFGVPGFFGQSPYPPAVNYLYAIPLSIPRALTVDRIAIYIVTGVALGAARIGLYSDNGSMAPGALLNAGGAITATAAGLQAVTISQALSKGLIWLAFVDNNVTIAVDLMRPSFSLIGMVGVQSFPFGMRQRVFTYAALPDPWGTPDDPAISGHYWNVTLRLLTLD